MELTKEGRQAAEECAALGSMIGKVALGGEAGGWPLEHVATAIGLCNEVGAASLLEAGAAPAVTRSAQVGPGKVIRAL